MAGDDTSNRIGNPLATDPDRLDSWKDIAVYLKRDVRTVRRWEEKEHLPVHRHLHSKRGSVYASKSELDAWWNQGRGRLDLPSRLAARERGLRWLAVTSLVLLALATGWYFARQRSASLQTGTVRL